jgi:hypothetical protein
MISECKQLKTLFFGGMSNITDMEWLDLFATTMHKIENLTLCDCGDLISPETVTAICQMNPEIDFDYV